MLAQLVTHRRKRILIVDDDPDNAELLAQSLGGLYDVFIAYDGVQGLDIAAECEPDLIISDVSMPQLGGLKMVRQMRSRYGLRCPVIFLSGCGGTMDIIAGISAGARHYLTKPVDLADLKRRVAKAFEY